jgi:predicted ATPase/DNA-binding SARP family transcriptional activator/DNA-binding CsgD family transcriptional regulator/Tfp pilus assembly protein PilF
MGSSGSKRARNPETPTGEKRKAVRVWMLGGFRVSVGSRTIPQDAWRLRKVATLVKLLALAPKHRLHREQAMDFLWPDSGKKNASNSLRKTLHVTRGTLERADGSGYLASEGESLVLCPGGELWMDVDAFEEAAVGARRSGDPAAYRAAINLYAGELLPEDRYEEWAEGRRQELRHTWLSLHRELARAYEGRGEYDKGIEVLQRAVSEEPTDQEVHASLMRLYAFSERRGEALAQYERLVGALSGQLDAQVSATTKRLREEIAAGTFPPAQPTGPPTVQPSDTDKHNLPASRTSFVGRENEMIEIKRHLAMTRLLTLTGAGGSGKTRLALEIARGLVGAYPDGVWLVELAPISEGELVPQTVARTLEISEQPGLPLTDTLVEALRAKQMLLVLDNCEHLVDAVGGLVGSLLDSCPHLKILATSRQALGAVGEVIWPVSLLSVPDPERVPTVAQSEGYEAMRLFVDRARQRKPAFTLRSQNVQAVAQICVRLEGLPLAIELAAARIKMLPPQALLSRLEDRLKLLTGGSRELSERQRTLKGTIEWSHALLDEGEQVLFARLAAFSGGRTLEAIEAVCDTDGDLPVDAFEGVSSLLDKSLLGQDEGTNGEPRFVMLETIHEFAREKLEESGEAEEIKRLHAEYFLTLAEEAYPESKGPDQLEWLERLEAEHDNMRAALSWALERKEAEVALRLGGALWRFWATRDYQSEGRRWFEEALAIDGRGSPVSRAMALAGTGLLAEQQGDLDRTQEACEEGLHLPANEASEAKLWLLTGLGLVAREREDYGRATRLFEESLALSREMSDTYWHAASLSDLAIVSHGRRDFKRATLLYEESIDLFREQGNKQGLSACLNNLGLLAYSQGELERAAQLMEEGVALDRELGTRQGVALGHCNLGWIALLREDLGRAADHYRESLSLSWDTGLTPLVQSVLEGFACVAGVRGQTERGVRLWGAAQSLHETKGIPRDDDFLAEADVRISAVRSSMGEEAWEEAWRKGRAMTLGEAVSYALEEEAETDPRTTSAPGEPPAGQAPVALSRREEEVAALVAQGLSNRQIASELSISEHTAATHVRRVLKKLGLRSRAQIGSWLTER